MTDKERSSLIERATLIVDGFAFLKESDDILTIVSLHEPFHVARISPNGEILETNMYDIELSLVKKYRESNKTLMEDSAYA